VTEPSHWFEAIANHLGESYLRYSFTMGTANEVAFLVDELDLRPGQRVLDVGCGPGRHARALGERGIEVVGVDIAQRFVDLARIDADHSLCQGAFGLAGGAAATGPDPDGAVLDGMARALRPGGRLAVSAFSAYFQVRWLEDSDSFDADAGVNHEMASLRAPDGTETTSDLWTTCFTPRELRLLAGRAGLVVDAVWSVTPGDYSRRPPEIDRPEFLLLATRPDG
jgi:SAM-dependent methyltransferase